MMVMSTPYELNGRVDQKRRTRDALVAAARELVARGPDPTVEAAAEAASISRTTAYRYFPNQRALLWRPPIPETVATSMLPDDPPDDVGRPARPRRRRVPARCSSTPRRSSGRCSASRSRPTRPSGRSSPASGPGHQVDRGGARAARSPTMSEAEIHRLALAIRSATGIEALAWLTDIGGLSRAEATDLMRWSAQAMLQAAVEHRLRPAWLTTAFRRRRRRWPAARRRSCPGTWAGSASWRPGRR